MGSLLVLDSVILRMYKITRPRIARSQRQIGLSQDLKKKKKFIFEKIEVKEYCLQHFLFQLYINSGGIHAYKSGGTKALSKDSFDRTCFY